MRHTMIGPTRSSRIARIAIALAAFGSCVLLVMPAARADCPVTDLSCVTEPVEDTVDETVETVEETVEGTVETLQETVEDTVETVEETVGDTIETIENTIDPGEETIDPIDEAGSLVNVLGDSVVAGEDPPGPVREGGTGAESGSGADTGGAGSDGRSVGDPVRPTSLIGSLVPAAASGPAAAVRTSPSDGPGGFGGFSANVVAGLAFPVVLALVVGAFVAAQNRLDRSDPKLALAPVGPDVLSFA